MNIFKVVDISQFESDPIAVSDKILDALISSGFFLISGHNVDVDTIVQLARQFYQLGKDEKDKIHIKNHNGVRGYSGLGSEVTKNLRDWHECLDYGLHVPKEHKDFGKPMHLENPYPAKPEGFKEAIEKYYEEMNRVAMKVLKAIEIGMNLKKGLIDDTKGEPFSLLRILHYPILPEDKRVKTEENNDLDIGIGCGEHTDYGFLTMVHSRQPGLQVLYNGEFFSPSCDGNHFVGNKE